MAARRRWALSWLAILACACAGPRYGPTRATPPGALDDNLPPGVRRFDEKVMTPPVLVYGPVPRSAYPAIEGGYRGSVVAWCVITEEGRVTLCRVIAGPRRLEALARDLEERRYAPATLDGKPIAVAWHFKIAMDGLPW